MEEAGLPDRGDGGCRAQGAAGEAGEGQEADRSADRANPDRLQRRAAEGGGLLKPCRNVRSRQCRLLVGEGHTFGPGGIPWRPDRDQEAARQRPQVTADGAVPGRASARLRESMPTMRAVSISPASAARLPLPTRCESFTGNQDLGCISNKGKSNLVFGDYWRGHSEPKDGVSQPPHYHPKSSLIIEPVLA